MADVARDRGQLIVVTGLLLAVAIVGLVLVLNTAIYTENLASRGTDQSSREAVEYRATMTDGVRGLAESENDREGGDHGEVFENVSEGIATIDNRTARSYAARGSIVGIDLGSLQIHTGTVVRQPDQRGFVTESGTPDWTPVADVEATRSFSLVVQNDTDLVSTNASRADADGAFTVSLDGGSWRLFVYRNDTAGGDLSVAVDDGTATEVWSSDASEARIDLTNESINEDPRSALNFSDDVTATYDVSFEDGDNATGTYELTVRGDSVTPSDYADPPDSPHYVAVVYSIDLPLYFESSAVTYRTTVRIVPEVPT